MWLRPSVISPAMMVVVLFLFKIEIAFVRGVNRNQRLGRLLHWYTAPLWPVCSSHAINTKVIKSSGENAGAVRR